MRSLRKDKMERNDSYVWRTGQQTSERNREKAMDREEKWETAAKANMQGQQMVTVGLKWKSWSQSSWLSFEHTQGTRTYHTHTTHTHKHVNPNKPRKITCSIFKNSLKHSNLCRLITKCTYPQSFPIPTREHPPHFKHNENNGQCILLSGRLLHNSPLKTGWSQSQSNALTYIPTHLDLHSSSQ